MSELDTVKGASFIKHFEFLKDEKKRREFASDLCAVIGGVLITIAASMINASAGFMCAGFVFVVAGYFLAAGGGDA